MAVKRQTSDHRGRRRHFDLIDIPYADATFDVIFAGHVDEHIERRLGEVGFDLTVDDLIATLDPVLIRRYRIDPSEKTHYCVKPRARGPSRFFSR